MAGEKDVYTIFEHGKQVIGAVAPATLARSMRRHQQDDKKLWALGLLSLFINEGRKMGRKGSLRYQAQQVLKGMKAFGESRHAAKNNLAAKGKIFSFQTFRTYSYQLCGRGRFLDWAKQNNPGIKDLQHALEPEVVNRYIAYMQQRGDKPASQATAIAAIAKIAGCSKSDYAPTAPVRRVDIERSRFNTASDRLFNIEKNHDLIDVCRATGLRRCEVNALRPEWLQGNANNGYRLIIPAGVAKGGKPRELPIRGETAARAVEVITATYPSNKVFPGGADRRADIHGYRREYAAGYYKELCRDVRTLDRNQTYVCRKDRVGVIYDRVAMRVVSQALGHSRVNVIASNYL